MTTKSPYKTKRGRAYRNLIVAAVNAALDQNLFDLASPDWKFEHIASNKFRWSFEFPGGLKGIAHAHDSWHSELTLHAALEPGETGADWINAAFAGFSAGKVWGASWIKFGRSPHVQDFQSSLRCRAPLLDAVADAQIAPNGFIDHHIGSIWA